MHLAYVKPFSEPTSYSQGLSAESQRFKLRVIGQQAAQMSPLPRKAAPLTN